MNRQEALDITWHAFVTRGEPLARNAFGGDGHRCAIGRLVDPDTAMHMQKTDIGPIGDCFDELGEPFANTPLPRNIAVLGEDFLYGLQRAHDDAADPFLDRNIEDTLRKLANEWGLVTPDDPRHVAIDLVGIEDFPSLLRERLLVEA